MESTVPIANDFVLESSLLKLPQELLRNNLKSQQRLVERDMAFLSGSFKQINSGTNRQQIQQKLDVMISRLRQMQAKMEGLRTEEQEHILRSRRRLKHMHELTSESSAVENDVTETRSKRLIVEFMLRQGFSEIAGSLAKQYDMEPLLDIEVFVQSKTIMDALLRRNTSDCIAWCSEHKSTLRKTKNVLEFELRRQEFIELLRDGKTAEAIQYAQKNIAPHREAQQRKVDQVCALLCYNSDTMIEPYKSLYAQSRWEYLADLFLTTHHALYNIPSKSPLEVALSAGLSALKTSNCYASTEQHKKSASTCPVCSPELNELAREVPFAHAVRSHLVDSIAGEPMEGENEPVALPNGRVYGSQSLFERCKSAGPDSSLLQDPETGEVFSRSMVRKAYVL